MIVVAIILASHDLEWIYTYKKEFIKKKYIEAYYIERKKQNN